MKIKTITFAFVLAIIISILAYAPTLSIQRRLDKIEARMDKLEKVEEILSQEINLSPVTFIYSVPSEGLMEALYELRIPEPEIVYAQALLETGNFTSRGCIELNNLFGFMQGDSLMRFDHWIESVVYYKRNISSKYKEGQDYYKFLENIKYAQDPQYTTKLRKLQ